MILCGENGGNGGFVLRRRSSSIAAISTAHVQKLLETDPRDFRKNEDAEIVAAMCQINQTFAPRADALCFSAETDLDCPGTPCGVHQIWQYYDAAVVRNLLDQA